MLEDRNELFKGQIRAQIRLDYLVRDVHCVNRN